MKANLDNDRFWFSLLKRGIFEVNRRGRIKRVKTGYQDWTVNAEYVRVTYQDRYILGHRLVYIAFKGLIEDSTLEVNHKDGDKLNNRLSNLELLSSSGNHKHALDTGLRRKSTPKSRRVSSLKARGEGNPNATITNDQVEKYRGLFAKGEISLDGICTLTRCNRRTVRAFLRGVSYKHVGGARTNLLRTWSGA